MGPYVDSIVPDEVLPSATAVVIIGGGIIGTSAALWLADRGVAVVLCEKGHLAIGDGAGKRDAMNAKCRSSSRVWLCGGT
jgi:glycine/D-amino acid oxidase-like deaminating enzyme